MEYTEEKLNSLDRETIIQLLLSQQEHLEQMKQIDHNLQLVLEQMADLKRHCFGRSTEKHEMEDQLSFVEVDGKIVFFNESEAGKKAWRASSSCGRTFHGGCGIGRYVRERRLEAAS